jgi:hypothetical protein
MVVLPILLFSSSFRSAFFGSRVVAVIILVAGLALLSEFGANYFGTKSARKVLFRDVVITLRYLAEAFGSDLLSLSSTSR